jgi:hypothetical protein
VTDRSGKKTVLVKDREEFEKLWNSAIDYSEKARKIVMNSGSQDFGRRKMPKIKGKPSHN